MGANVNAKEQKEVMEAAKVLKAFAQEALQVLNDAQAQALANIAKAETRAKEAIWAEQDKAVALINQGLAAITELHAESLAKLEGKVNAEIEIIHQIAKEAVEVR